MYKPTPMLPKGKEALPVAEPQATGLLVTGASLPGENKAELDELRAQLFRELCPRGTLQKSYVETIVALIWRKRNLPIFRRAAKVKLRYGRHFTDGDAERGIHEICRAEFKYANKLIEELRRELAAAETSVPSSEDPPDLEQAFREAALLMEGGEALFGPGWAPRCTEKMDRHSEDIDLAALGDAVSPQALLQDLELLESIDGSLEDAYRRLFALQAQDERRPRRGVVIGRRTRR